MDSPIPVQNDSGRFLNSTIGDKFIPNVFTAC